MSGIDSDQNIVMGETNDGAVHVVPAALIDNFSLGIVLLSEIEDGEKIMRVIAREWLKNITTKQEV